MTTHTEPQRTVKSLIRDVIDAQPEDASYEEIMRELAFDRMVAHGLADVRAGRTLDHAEALRNIRSWRN